MPRYGQSFKDKAVARPLPPESATVETVAREAFIGVRTCGGKSAGCREHGVYPMDLSKWCSKATAALADPEEVRASPQATRSDRKRNKELEREILPKNRALAETAAWLVLSKKISALFSASFGNAA